MPLILFALGIVFFVAASILFVLSLSVGNYPLAIVNTALMAINGWVVVTNFRML